MNRYGVGLVLVAMLCACKSDDGDGSGDLGACGQFDGCGGDLVGTWTIDSACTDNFIRLMGTAVDQPECGGLIVDTQSDATGTFTFTANTLSSSATLSIDVTARYTPACVMALANGAAVDLAATCSSLSDQYAMMPSVSGASCAIEGDNCDCILSFDQPVSTNEMYTVSGNTITYPNDPDPITYCVTGNQLQMGGRTMGAALLLTLTRQ